MEILPISCVSCRRMKIKCNKLYPCNQCMKRGIPCQYPGKFRNIELGGKVSKTVLRFSDDSSDDEDLLDPHRVFSSKSKSLAHMARLEQQIRDLQHENQQLKRDMLKTSLETEQLLQSTPQCHSHVATAISGETTEDGEKYYGPQSAEYMTRSLQGTIDQSFPAEAEPIKQEPLDAPGTTAESMRWPQRKSSYHQRLKRLPNLILGSKPSSEAMPDVHSLNKNAIAYLINNFFDRDLYHQTLLSRTQVLENLELFDNVSDEEWEQDDDLLLLNSILLCSVEALTPRECMHLGIMPHDSAAADYQVFIHHLTHKVLLRSILELRHNLLSESHLTVASYILCAEWYFHDRQYEESFSMIFHATGVAYAIGLHIIGDLRRLNGQEPQEMAEDHEAQVQSDFTRFKTWFGLKFVAGQICSILGRPNPILVRASEAIMRNAAELSSILENDFQRAMLKIGLSECLRLSNTMLIESFMMDILEQDLSQLDSKFYSEIHVCELLLSKMTSANQSAALYDLVLLLIHRAKLLHPFVAKFAGKSTAPAICDNLIKSLQNAIRYLSDLIAQFRNDVMLRFEMELDLQLSTRTRIAAKIFSLNFPFLSLLVHQGLIVMLGYFCQCYRGNISFTEMCNISEVERLLHHVLDAGETIVGGSADGKCFWSTNVTKVSGTLFDLFGRIRRQQNQVFDASDPRIVKSEARDAGSFDMADPYWYSYPENVPYVLSSPDPGDRALANRSLLGIWEEERDGMGVPPMPVDASQNFEQNRPGARNNSLPTMWPN